MSLVPCGKCKGQGYVGGCWGTQYCTCSLGWDALTNHMKELRSKQRWKDAKKYNCNRCKDSGVLPSDELCECFAGRKAE